ncbi:hypothetical protein PILCRDRAFT_818401 [Piloderma croceum F 1598]|uniref:Mediator of RNA polymerase II transcription subunit 19 n=1 Tax=Piloderma croceum (strain F 1598) TaxID=765440 RepID=A0A0C3FX35_PILCF|nr:hypothetical protein PILCRDRAFT_818401 [Piloderma croceum F 1598]
MDVDEQPIHHSEHINAVAGPSTLAPSPALFLPPPAHPQPPVYLTSTQDLLARFHLLPAYDKYVRPYVTPVDDGHDHPPTPGTTDKGKGKEKELATETPDDGQDADEEDGGKKKKNSYKHLIKGVPGKHSMRKDEYLTTIMQVPPKQRMAITPFDQKTQREAFSVSLEGLKGWNINTLVLESAQAREDRKKRKELKKLAKANAANVMATPSAASPSVAGTFGAPTPGSSTGPASSPKLSKLPPVQIPTNQDSTRGGTPRATPTNSVSQQQHSVLNGGALAEKRGKKRDHDEATRPPPQQQGPAVQNLNQNGVVPKAVIAKPGVRPRPMKKQRMDLAGQAREIPVQQPTPQGV